MATTRRLISLPLIIGAIAALGTSRLADASVLPTSPQTPAPIVEPIDDCAWAPRQTPYQWTQDVCLYDGIFGDGLISIATIELQPDFARANVKKCRIRMRLTSSYGSVHWAHIDCTGEARGGGDATIDASWNWGLGRRPGDRYTVEAWAEITTGVTTYGGRPWAATSTTTKR